MVRAESARRSAAARADAAAPFPRSRARAPRQPRPGAALSLPAGRPPAAARLRPA